MLLDKCKRLRCSKNKKTTTIIWGSIPTSKGVLVNHNHYVRRCASGLSNSSWLSLTPCVNMPTMYRFILMFFSANFYYYYLTNICWILMWTWEHLYIWILGFRGEYPTHAQSNLTFRGEYILRNLIWVCKFYINLILQGLILRQEGKIQESLEQFQVSSYKIAKNIKTVPR